MSPVRNASDPDTEPDEPSTPDPRPVDSEIDPPDVPSDEPLHTSNESVTSTTRPIDDGDD